MDITDTQSYSHVIRDVFFNTVTTDAFFASYTCRKNKMLVARPEYLPYLGVYIIDDTMTPDGDGNAGNYKFIHGLRIGFSVMQANNDQDALELGLDAAYRRIELVLWNNPYINNVIDTTNPHTGLQNPDNVMWESIERGMRRYVWGNTSFNNETPVGEMQYDITVRHRTYWPPGPFDDLDTIDVVMPVGESEQIHVQYDFGSSAGALQTPTQRGYSRASFAAKRHAQIEMRRTRQELRDHLASRRKGHGHNGR
jgi:hypothetical protein